MDLLYRILTILFFVLIGSVFFHNSWCFARAIARKTPHPSLLLYAILFLGSLASLALVFPFVLIYGRWSASGDADVMSVELAVLFLIFMASSAFTLAARGHRYG